MQSMQHFPPMRRAVVLVAVLAIGLSAAACDADHTKLPLGDGATSTSPQVGKVFACNTQPDPRAGGAQVDGPWIDAANKTWDQTKKIAVQGSVTWPSQFNATVSNDAEAITGNGLPSTATGTFPVAPTDPAHQYDANPNSITPYTLAADLPANPTVNATATCVGGTIGISVLGAQIFSAFDALNRDAVAHEVQDKCDGHPQRTGVYHFHSLSSCFTSVAGADPGLFGYALDGFGIYVEKDDDGKNPISLQLDECHGRVSEITWHGQKKTMYHYVATDDFPYLVGCFRGTPITSATGMAIGRPAG
jgi:YHYH protein